VVGGGDGLVGYRALLTDVPACFGRLCRRFGPGGMKDGGGVSFVIKSFIYTILREINFYAGR